MNRRTGVHRCTDRIQIAVVLTPIAAHQIQRRKTQMRLFRAARHVHTHEPDTLPVADRTYRLHVRRIAAQRYLELIPVHRHRLAVTQIHLRRLLLHDMLQTHLHHVRAQLHAVLVVFLVLVERIVLVDIFDIRVQGRGRSVTLRLLFGRG